ARRVSARVRRRPHRRRRARDRERLRAAHQPPTRASQLLMMDFDEIKQILEMMREHDIAEFELERDNVKLRLRKGAAGHWTAAPAAPQGHYAPMPAAAPAAADAVPVLAPADEA